MRTFELSEHSVEELIEEAVAAFEPTRTRRDVDLSVEVTPGLQPVVCDRPAIVDALVNLLSNAYKYGGNPRQIRITATTDDARMRIQVHDNGLGIERREHKRIFLKFYRIDDKLRRKQEGSGLGLAIVQYVLRAHSGKVEVDSAPGHGSTFSLVLPLRRPVTDRLLPQGPATLTAKGT